MRDVLRVLAQLYNGTRGTVRHVAKDEVVLATDSRPPCSRASATSRPAPRKGSKWLRGTLTESAKAIVRTKGTYLVRPLPPDQEPPRTRQRTIATAHKIITAACHVLDRGVPYNELGEEFFYRRDTEHTERYRRLGHKVTLEPLEEAA